MAPPSTDIYSLIKSETKKALVFPLIAKRTYNDLIAGVAFIKAKNPSLDDAAVLKKSQKSPNLFFIYLLMFCYCAWLLLTKDISLVNNIVFSTEWKNALTIYIGTACFAAHIIIHCLNNFMINRILRKHYSR